ncbi:hypothetical protein O181_043276 [Austropuccinia psidii MF-1]|uniref:Uncharacterized protein n=1 Tax=Austropuccinia psidii MF-1 TaxID=1389203 RepID=A0A9Q3HFU6_9BASI|nr:hypothetical protein [Austropuccinia psidii MF-1]
MVWLSSKNIKSTKPTKKLSERLLDPFQSLRKSVLMPTISSFHPNENTSTNSAIFPSLNQSRPQQSQIDIVSLLLQSSFKRRGMGSLSNPGFQAQERRIMVSGEWKWFSEDPERSTLEPAENIKNCSELIKVLHSFYADKPAPNY